MTTSGWGSGGWGSSPWGSGAVDLQILRAVALRENMVRVFFSDTPYYSGDLDPHDASSRARFSFAGVSGTVGSDGLGPRAVLACRVDVASVPDALDVWTDRPLSPYPAEYIVSANQLASVAGVALDPTLSSAIFFGLRAAAPPNVAEAAAPSTDLAQPDSAAALQAAVGSANPALLGSLPVDSSGDYASDRGLVSYKKRIMRRCTTRRDSFAHLPGYGLGTLELVKQLGTLSVRSTLAAEAEAQCRQEPETVKATASFLPDESQTVWTLALFLETRSFGSVAFAVPFSPTG